MAENHKESDREQMEMLLESCSDEEVRQLLEVCKSVLVVLRSSDWKAITKRK